MRRRYVFFRCGSIFLFLVFLRNGHDQSISHYFYFRLPFRLQPSARRTPATNEPLNNDLFFTDSSHNSGAVSDTAQSERMFESRERERRKHLKAVDNVSL